MRPVPVFPWPWAQAAALWLRTRLRLPAGDLLRERVYRRLWTSILISSFGGQITLLALPLTAAVLLQASPTQMGLLTAMEIVPFVLFSLPGGVWLDRVRKLPVYIAGETLLALVVASVPLAWWLGLLSMAWLYVAGFVIGTVYTLAGSAAQIVLTQVVGRERLVEAHAKNALATSGAEVTGPALAGALIRLVGAPLALLADALASRGRPRRVAPSATSCARACSSCGASGCSCGSRWWWAAGSACTTWRWWCRSCSPPARWA
ncbi:MFS transporter [Piscinibacter sakaiensis]|uniref:MFS transporter n=1 Tax=Piscinibacter sakaiensis TaxID=1547922 RepID=UPI0037271C25